MPTDNGSGQATGCLRRRPMSFKRALIAGLIIWLVLTVLLMVTLGPSTAFGFCPFVAVLTLSPAVLQIWRHRNCRH